MNLKKEEIILWLKKILICTFSLFLLGIAGALNIKASLGSDPITVFYEGLSGFLHLDIGITINTLNLILTVAIFFIDRKYIHIGTVIYVFVLGYFVEIGLWIYDLLPISEEFVSRLIISLIGCFIAFLGVSMYISIDIGVDPWSAISLIITKRTGKSFGTIRFFQDAITLVLGMILGGVAGIITIFCSLVGGPTIQKLKELIDKILENMLKSKCENQVKS